MNLLKKTNQEKTTSSIRRTTLSIAAVLLLMFIGFTPVKGETASLQDTRLSINLKSKSIEQVLREIEKKSNYHFLYNNQLINVQRKVNIDMQNKSIGEILNYLFTNDEIDYNVSGNRIVLSPKGLNTPTTESAVTQQQTRRITGQVTDEDKEPLPGATIVVKETNRGAITNVDGEFDLTLNENENTLVVTFVGMDPQTIKVGNQRVFNITLQQTSGLLDEVIVTGYQTISKERATGAFAVISPTVLKNKLQVNVLSRLEGQVAGLYQRGRAFNIRGISSLREKSSTPLIVVDGVPFEGDIKSVNPSIIENITVLKDAAAASIYGARAANGVVVITTKGGSRDGKTHVSYDGSIGINPIPNYNYLNLLNSEELVNLQQYGFKFMKGEYEQFNKRHSLNPVIELLLKHRSKLITDVELENGLNIYRNLDNREQIKDFYLQTGVVQQHNLSLTGGNPNNRYFASINYTTNRGNSKYSNDESLGFNLRNNMKFFDWLSADLGVTGNFSRAKGDTGMGNAYEFYTENPSYYMLRDENGSPLNILRNKSAFELERLRSIGLKDETYSPITNRDEEYFRNKKDYYRLHMGLNVKLMEGLNLDVIYQTETSITKQNSYFSKNSYYVRSLINNAAQYNKATKELTLNVPDGAQMQEKRSDLFSYTFRTQLNYTKETGKHYITALGGAERRLIKGTSASLYLMGYNNSTLGYKPIQAITLNELTGTEALSGFFSWSTPRYNFVGEQEDRFVSFYANASYSYDYKYNLTGSIRIDQSNLFGTDPKYQYRPLWSLGASWFIGNEDFLKSTEWLDKLNLRLTYGIGGNIPKDAGPFLTLSAAVYDPWIGDFASGIKNPPNYSLRWEKTTTTNLGLDFALFGNKINGTIDFYRKNSSDLLAYRDTDPTIGWDNLLLNYGKMQNKGIDLSLMGNFIFGNLSWRPSIIYSLNKNKLVDVEDSNITAFSFTQGNASVKGYPLGAIFSYRYAGLNPQTGIPLYYNAKGDVVPSINSIDDLVFSGTNVPTYSGSISNTLSYKNIDFSFMFVYYGGHKMRIETASFLSSVTGANINREILNTWKKPGDEKNPETTPAITGGTISYDIQHMWHAADKHVVDGGYLKLRDVSLTYNFDNQLISKWNMEALSLTLQVQNLWTIAANKKGFDPEAIGSKGYGWGARALPTPTSYTIGASINF